MDSSGMPTRLTDCKRAPDLAPRCTVFGTICAAFVFPRGIQAFKPFRCDTVNDGGGEVGIECEKCLVHAASFGGS